MTNDNQNLSAIGRPRSTETEFDTAIAMCREMFVRKMGDYGPSWRIMRPESLTDQILIKAKRIRSLQEKGGQSMVGEGIFPEFIAIVNYGIMALIQLTLPSTITVDMSAEKATAMYDETMASAKKLMLAKNHDYDEAWRLMRVGSYVDFILTKVMRNKEIENHHGHTSVSEGVEGNYMDMVNYALFGIIKLKIENQDI